MSGQTTIAKRAKKFLGIGAKNPKGLNKVLQDLLERSDLKLVDIGARGGAQDQLKVLAPFSHYYACEPDSREAVVLPEKLREDAPWREITVIPYAISLNEGEATLNLTKQPGLSSLLKPNYPVVHRFHTAGFFDIESTAPVKTISLDHSAAQYGFNDACFIKLDTQGTELDILRSGSRLLEASVLGVYVEVSFHDFYQGQPLFSDVDSYLREKEFSLFGLELKLKRRAECNPRIFSRGQPVWGNALYLKEPEVIFREKNDAEALREVSRLLGISLAYGYYDFALELTKNGRPALLFRDVYGDSVYISVREYVQYRKS